MGLSFRKSVKLGPIRLNFSGKGVGVSTGVTGARVSMGPTGTHISLGRQGVYYRKKIGGGSNRQPREEKASEVSTEVKYIETADVKNFQKSSGDKLLAEINYKSSLVQFMFVSLAISGITFIASLMHHAPGWVTAVIIALSVLSYYFCRKKDYERKTVRVSYDLKDAAQKNYAALNKGFEKLLKTEQMWWISSTQEVTDWKRNSGASNTIRRHNVQISQELPAFFESNFIPHTLHADNRKYYFFPDRILMQHHKEFGTINYGDVRLVHGSTTFIEEDSVPGDSQLIGHTWKYPNKSGGPDRRFSDNYEIPLLSYAVLHLHTASGLNVLLYVSSKHAANAFVENFAHMGASVHRN